MLRGHHTQSYVHISRRLILEDAVDPKEMELGVSSRYIPPKKADFPWTHEISEENKTKLLNEFYENRRRMLSKNPV